MPESRRPRRRRSQPETSSPNVFSRLIPDIVEQPLTDAAEGAAGLAGNLFGDIKDAVVGLPMGIVAAAQDPIKSARAVGNATWATWSPLFHGDVGKFAQGIYDHPLAPLLDVATVFSLGAGGVARGASALEKAGSSSSAISKAANLRKTKAIELPDPSGKERLIKPRNLSTRAGRRLIQEGMIALEPHLPSWYGKTTERLRFEKRFAIEGAHKVAAKNLMLQTALSAARTLDDPETAPRARAEIAVGMYTGLIRHNEKLDPEDALRVMRASPRDYRLVKDAALLNPLHARQVRTVQRDSARAEKERAATAELSHAAPRIYMELKRARADLAAMQAGTHPAVRGVLDQESGIRADIDAANDDLARMSKYGHVVPSPSKSKRKAPTVRQLMEHEGAARAEGQRYVGLLEKEYTATRKERMARIQEQEQLIARLEGRHKEATAAGFAHDAALARGSELAKQRIELEQRSFAQFFDHVGTSAEAFDNFAMRFGRKSTTQDIAKAARSQDGKVTLVRVEDARKLGLEASNSSKFLQVMWRKPTTLWKILQIGYAPRAITNNAVGNWTMYALREGGDVESVAALWPAMRHMFGRDKAVADMMISTPFKRNHWLYRHFGDELGNVFGHDLLHGGDAKGVKRRLMGGLYPVVHKVADEPVRVAAIQAYLRRAPEVKALMKRGQDADSAIKRALRTTPGLRDRAAEHARVVAGDYFTLRGPERFIRDLMPFYLWNRHIVKTTANMVADTPGRVALMQRISNLGIERTEELLGELPEFLRGAIPLEAIGLVDEVSKDRADVLLTTSLNPFATISELASLTEAFTTGTGPRGLSSALMGANPLLTGSVEAVTGRSLLTGAPKPVSGGLIQSVLASGIEGLPFTRLAGAAVTPDTEDTPKGNPRLYAADDRGPVTSFLGIPLRDVSKAQAAELAEKERPKKKETRRGGRERRRGR